MFSKSVFRRPGVTRHFCNQFAINAGLLEPYELDQPSDGGRLVRGLARLVWTKM
jgi:hypothetical protein